MLCAVSDKTDAGDLLRQLQTEKAYATGKTGQMFFTGCNKFAALAVLAQVTPVHLAGKLLEVTWGLTVSSSLVGVGMQVHERNVALDPVQVDASVQYELGMLAFKSGSIEAALRFMSQACTCPEAPALWHRNHGEILDRCGKSEAAEAAARLALRLEPDCASAWDTLGTILAQRGEFAEACTCYQRAVQIEPIFLQALNNLAVALDRLGRLDAAEARFKQVLCLAPEHPEIRLNFATLMGELGRYREGLRIVQQVLDRCPDMMRAQSMASEFAHNIRRHATSSI